MSLTEKTVAEFERDNGYIGIEIEEHYCEIAVRRLDQMVLPFEVKEQIS